MPSQSLIKSICYPQLFKFTSKATDYGCQNEGAEVNAYANAMSQKHKDFTVAHSGLLVDKMHPWIHATPDFMPSCSCCGNGCGEVKCPYTLKNWDFDSYIKQNIACLEKSNGSLRLKRNHQYYYQVQQQMFVSGCDYCDFVVCAFNMNNQPMFFLERINKNPSHWETVLPKLTEFWRTCILAEILGRWYTRKHNPPVTITDKPSDICYCRKQIPNENTVVCNNPQCNFTKFHYSCLKISGPLPNLWYCPSCRLLPEFQKSKKSAKAKKAVNHDLQKQSDLNEAIKLNTICICNAKPKPNEKLLKCHNTDGCYDGGFFHLECLGYKRMPNKNCKTTWICKKCKVKRQPESNKCKSVTCSSVNFTLGCENTQGSDMLSMQNTESTTSTNTTDQAPYSSAGNCTSLLQGSCIGAAIDNSLNTSLSSECSASDFHSKDDVEITLVTTGVANKVEPFETLNENDCNIILLPSGWLDCKIIQAAQVKLKMVNPLIEGFQRTTLGPVKNFDIMSSEFVQILHTGRSHWVCASSIGCQPGYVNVYDSLYNEIIEDEVEEQVKDLLGDRFIGIINAPVQQQLNGSDCGVFAIAFATCLVHGTDPQIFMFDIPQMRPHLLNCLKAGDFTLFPHF